MMKRTKGLKRTGTLKRSRLKPRSEKRRQRMDAVRDFRQAYLAEFDRCAVCGKPSTEVHEICNGPSRDKSLDERAAILATCNHCNFHKLTDKVLFSVERQLVIKALVDPEGYDRRRVNELRNRSPEAISEQEVIQAAYELGREGL